MKICLCSRLARAVAEARSCSQVMGPWAKAGRTDAKRRAVMRRFMRSSKSGLFARDEFGESRGIEGAGVAAEQLAVLVQHHERGVGLGAVLLVHGDPGGEG